MKKLVKDNNPKSVAEIEKKVQETRQEIAKLQLSAQVNPQKDTNMIFKKRKQIAVLLTLLNEKKASEVLAVKS